MIVPDIDLRLHAYDSSSHFSRQGDSWWETCLAELEPVDLLPVVGFGFVGIATNACVFRNPMTPAEAIGHVRT